MFDFDEVIDQRGTACAKWDDMERHFGVSPEDGLAMWVADMDFRSPPAVNRALAESAERGVHGYFGGDGPYIAAITGWMQRRHGWEVNPDWITSVHGLVAGVGTVVRAFTEPGDGIVLLTPVYHAFARIIKANDRRVHEAPLRLAEGRFELDLESLKASLTGAEKMLIFCSPHNPGGRIWTPGEQRALAEFCAENGLLLVSDEIHHDLVLPDHRHVPMPLAAPGHEGNLVMLTAATKTFNIAAALTGNVIIPDPALRERFMKAHLATGSSVNRMGAIMVTAAYSEGDAWCDAVCAYIAENARTLSDGIAGVPGASMMAMEATYLAWVDFRNTGMDQAEISRRLKQDARIAATDGPVFGSGGEGFMRFNIAMPRSRIEDAANRIREAFADLQ